MLKLAAALTAGFVTMVPAWRGENGQPGSYTMFYENTAWKLQPAPAGLALYKLGAVKAIAAQKKAGTCAGSGS